jgi:UDP-N-acetylglucosamine--N-acetylmuramyl-(pentapeptide) pyrophosphoryl-undecaprenol N-acetylglucosamine transferase
VRVLPFLERIELAYAAADLVVARAGASTVAEVAVCGVPSILIPYPYATGRHQEANARALQRAGGASVLLDDELTGAVLAERVTELLDAPATLTAMGERARAWSRPDASSALARVVGAAGGDA